MVSFELKLLFWYPTSSSSLKVQTILIPRKGLFYLGYGVLTGSIPAITGSSWLWQQELLLLRFSLGLRIALVGWIVCSWMSRSSSTCIGGQAFVIKLRRTAEGSAFSMVVDPPHGLNGTDKEIVDEDHLKWRHLM